MLHAALALALTFAPGPREPATPRPGQKLLVAGGITLGTGAASSITALVLTGPRNKDANDIAHAASPGETGFPPGRWSDSRGAQHRIDRYNVAIRVLAITGAVLVVAGATLLITGAVLKRDARRDHARVRLGPDLTLRF